MLRSMKVMTRSHLTKKPPMCGKNLEFPVTEFTSFLISTRSSGSSSATLQDFILGEISIGKDVAVEKTADSPTAYAEDTDALGFTVTVTNVGVGDLQNVILTDPLPSGAAGDIVWSIPDGDNQSGLFVLDGTTPGSQTLTLASGTNLAFNESISVSE